MHSFLKSVGFSKIKCRHDTEKLIGFVVENATDERVVKLNDDFSAAELVLEVADNMGLIVRGEYDKQGNFYAEHFFPYYCSQKVSTAENCFVTKRVDSDSYMVMCEDYRLGVSLIFYLQNAIDYRKARREGLRDLYPVRLSALARDGKILLPALQTEKQLAQKKDEILARSKLILEAKMGNQEAMESLTMEDIDQYAIVSKRIRQEDVYSIVESTFIPHGSESDNYMVLGTIREVKSVMNFLTQEECYILAIACNDVDIAVCINKNDLLGEPLPGRRFRGVVWLQGLVEFWV